MEDLRQAQENLLCNERNRVAWDRFASQTVVPVLVEFVHKRAEQDQAREILLELLGEDFAEKHLPGMKRDRKLLFPPYMAPEMKLELMRSMQQDLQKTVEEALDETNPDLLKSFGETFRDSCLSVCSQCPSRSKADVLAGIFTQVFLGTGFDLTIASDRHRPELESESLQELSLKSAELFLQMDEHRFDGLVEDKKVWQTKRRSARTQFFSKCRGRSLPPTLRRSIFREALLDPNGLGDVAREISRNLSHRAAPSLADQSLHPSHSKINNLISRLVEESLRAELAHWIDKGEVVKAWVKDLQNLLNQYYVMTGYYHATVLSLAVPLYAEFHTEPDYSPLMLLSMLDALRRAVPSRSEAAAVAKSIWSMTHQRSPETAILVRNLLEKHNQHQRETCATIYSDDQEVLPFHLFLPWVETSLVSVLRRNAALFVWTECFCYGTLNGTVWDVERFKELCVSVFVMLHDTLATIQTYSELSRVLKECPVQLFTSDIRNSGSSPRTQHDRT